MASGNVILPAYAGWVSGFLAEVERFPKGAHDDQLDPMFDAIQLVQQIPAQQNDWATAQLPNRRYVRLNYTTVIYAAL
jgi:phage terminase large subunit-like protein